MFLTIKLCTYAKLNCLKLFIGIKMDLTLNNLQRLICHKTLPTNQPIQFYPSDSLLEWRLLPYVCVCLCASVNVLVIPYCRHKKVWSELHISCLFTHSHICVGRASFKGNEKAKTSTANTLKTTAYVHMKIKQRNFKWITRESYLLKHTFFKNPYGNYISYDCDECHLLVHMIYIARWLWIWTV